MQIPGGDMNDSMRWGISALVATLALAACGDPEVIVPDLLGVTILPSHGAIGIGTDVEGLVYFTHPVASGDSLADSIQIDCLPEPACSPTPAADCSGADPASIVTYDSVNRVARIQPTAALDADTCYVIIVAAGLVADASDVAALPTEIRSRFRTQ